MPRISRVSAQTRKTVRDTYRKFLFFSMAAIALFALFDGDYNISYGWSPASSTVPLSSWHATASRKLFASHEYAVTDTCKAIPTANATKDWQTECCPAPPASKEDLTDWWKACQNTDYLMGSPSVSCLARWYDGAVKCAQGEAYVVTSVCSLKMRCSDMGMYQSISMDVGKMGYTPGMTVPYILFLLYVFVGLAIICDEYFVPAIDEISEVWNITPDVAGATLMAAGGSAPELATSFMGVFVSKSDVGFSTIVGSAVCAVCLLQTRTHARLT